MPKPHKVEQHIRDWLAAEGHDELVAFARVMQVSLPTQYRSVSPADPIWAAGVLGRELSDNAIFLGKAHAFVLTRSRFLVCNLSGWKERVKSAEIDVEANGSSLRYLDDVNNQGHTVRYLVVDLPDGRWVLDSLVYMKKSGNRGPFADTCDAFIAAFGDRAHRIDA